MKGRCLFVFLAEYAEHLLAFFFPSSLRSIGRIV